MHELDVRLERLAAEATRDAVPPELEAVARRGRHRRRHRRAGVALLVAAVVPGGLVLPSRLGGRAGHDPVPATAPATDVRGAARLGGYWLGKTDATVYTSASGASRCPGPCARDRPATPRWGTPAACRGSRR